LLKIFKTELKTRQAPKIFKLLLFQSIYSIEIIIQGTIMPIKLLLVLTFLYTSSFSSNNAKFTCSSEAYISYVLGNSNSSGTSYIDKKSLLNGAVIENKMVSGQGVNTIGYNVKDDNLWGFSLGEKKKR